MSAAIHLLILPPELNILEQANSPPTIQAATSFKGLGVLSTDEYVEFGGEGTDGLAKEWYVNTANFYRQIRNVKVDIRDAPADKNICAIHYQVAQATSMQNVELIAKTGTTQQGMCRYFFSPPLGFQDFALCSS